MRVLKRSPHTGDPYLATTHAPGLVFPVLERPLRFLRAPCILEADRSHPSEDLQLL